VQPFFSGIALDVTPQIDKNNSIILHLHPSVSNVAEKQKIVAWARWVPFGFRSRLIERDRHRPGPRRSIVIGGLMATANQ
jgi:MSHA biogenesis protein MshL